MSAGDFPCCGTPIDRGQTYTIVTAVEDTPDYKIGYRHGATGRQPLRDQSEAYRDGFAEGFIARREGVQS
jgi:hypothetical protein